MSRSSESASGKPESGISISALLEMAEADDYLLSLLLPRIRNLIKNSNVLFGTGDGAVQRGDNSIVWETISMAILHATTLYLTRGESPATRALGIKAEAEPLRNFQPASFPGGSNRTIPSVVLARWILLSVAVPTVYRLIELWKGRLNEQERLNSENNGRSSSSTSAIDPPSMAQVARQRKLQVLEYILDLANQTVPVARLVVLLSYWRPSSSALRPRLSTSGLAMLLAGVTYRSSCSERQASVMHVTYAHRRWLFDEVSRVIQTVSPASSMSELRSLYSGCLRPLSELWEQFLVYYTRNGSAGTCLGSKRDCCPICLSDSITIPYETNCGHVYCYTCLWAAQSSSNETLAPILCRVCGRTVSSATRCAGG